MVRKIDYLKKIGLFSLLLVISGCSSTLDVEGNFPTPIVNQLPYTVGIIYDDDFKIFRYTEQSDNRDDWDINLGEAQVKLFNTVLPAMFENVVTTQTLGEESDTNIDIYLKPSIDEFQYNIPSETKLKMFEIWIKYNLKVYDGKGQLIADWILTAYGKTPTAFMQTEKGALNEAMIIALRDAGAGLSLKFTHIPEINTWLKQKNATML